MEQFAGELCLKLQEKEKEIEDYFRNLAKLFAVQIPDKNNNRITDERLSERLREYIYYDHIMILDEKTVIKKILLDIAEERFFKIHPDAYSLNYRTSFINEDICRFKDAFNSCFDTLILRSIIDIISNINCTDDSPIFISEELKKFFLIMMHISQSNLKTIPNKTYCRISRSQLFKKYLD